MIDGLTPVSIIDEDYRTYSNDALFEDIPVIDTNGKIISESIQEYSDAKINDIEFAKLNHQFYVDNKQKLKYIVAYQAVNEVEAAKLLDFFKKRAKNTKAKEPKKDI